MKHDILRIINIRGGKKVTEKNVSRYIGRRIKYYRNLRNMTQKELGVLVGVEHNTISSYETGINRPGEDTLFAIAQALNVGIDDLFPPVKDSLILNTNKAKKKIGLYGVSSLVMLPVVGRISCGSGIIAYEDIESYEPIPKEWVKGGKYFCLRAKGDSMTGARIHEGDLLLIREQPEVENGEIAVVLIGDEAVLKRLYRSDDQIVLQSENPNYPPIFSLPAEVRVVGKLKKIVINM